MNIGEIEDETKAKVDNIKKQMRQQWILKTTEEISSNNESDVTQEVGDSILSN